MAHDDLCDRSHFPALAIPISEYRENPAFPVNEGYEAYTTLAECQKLVYDTLGHIARTHTFTLKLPVTVTWNSRLRTTLGHAEWHPGSVKRPAKIVIDLQPQVFYYASAEDRATTIIHESCHAANYMMGQVEVGHGKEWKDLMLACGLPPNRCGDLPLALTWHDKCPKCGTVWYVQRKEQFERIQRRMFCIVCRGCANKISDVSNATPPARMTDEWKRYMK